MNKIKLLDCTLRDGGYINDWEFGFDCAKDIIDNLIKANIDIIETGFLRNVDFYNPDKTLCSHIEEFNNLIPANIKNSSFAIMAMHSNYDIKNLSKYKGDGIEIIRVPIHDYNIKEELIFAKQINDKGYKLSINPINIMGYSKEQIIWTINEVNKIHPWQFSIVDSFGSMKKSDLDRIVSLVDTNLLKDIRLGLHLHENMALSFSLAQNFLEKSSDRKITVDGSLSGMGRRPGNLPIELIADYCNEYYNKNYQTDYLFEAIQKHIQEIKNKNNWGYGAEFFLSAKYNLHRDYPEYYIKKYNLSLTEINRILRQFDKSKKSKFDCEYADKLYFSVINS